MFGENFTLDGLLEESVHLGDRFAVGSAEVIVTQPRLPCYKLGIRFEADDMVKRFFLSRRTGFYLAVAREGEAAAGDDIEGCCCGDYSLVCRESVRGSRPSLGRSALQVAALPESWKQYFRKRLQQIPVSG